MSWQVEGRDVVYDGLDQADADAAGRHCVCPACAHRWTASSEPIRDGGVDRRTERCPGCRATWTVVARVQEWQPGRWIALEAELRP